MGAVDRGKIRCLALAGPLGIVIGLAAASASAKDKAPLPPENPQSTEPAAAPLEEENQEPQPTFVFRGEDFTADLTTTGVIDRAMLLWDDGRKTGAYFVDNQQDGSFLGVEGNVEFGNKWTVGAAAGADLLFAPSDDVDQSHPWGLDNRIDLSDLYATIGQENFGTIVVGYADTATDGIDNINLAELDTAADADVTNWNADFLIRPVGKGTSDVRWGDFIDGTLAGDTRILVGYTSPKVKGFEASAAAGDHYWDVALRYSGEWANTIEVESGIGYWQDTLADSAEPVADTGWGGSLAVKHIETGLNAAFNFGTASHTDNCFLPGAVSGLCRGDDTFYYVKGGIVRDFVDWGATAIYAEFYRETKKLNESDSGVLSALERDPGSAKELKRSLGTAWGVGVVQQVDDWNTELYLAYRRYNLNVDLLGATAPVAAEKFRDFGVVMAGAKISF